MSLANYVEETTTSIAGTSGDGDVTLSAQGNYPRFSSYWGSARRDVEYVIEDTTNGKFESGIGYVVSNVLTRSKPQITWNGTVADDTSPSALQFGSTPTTGNVRIRLSALVTSFVPSMRGQQRTVTRDADYGDYPWSHHISAGVKPSQTITLTADREYYVPWLLSHGGVLSGAQFEVTTLAGSSNLKWALYDHSSAFLPGAKILDFTTTSTASTGFKIDTAFTPTYLAPGWYWIGLINSHGPAIRCYLPVSGVPSVMPTGIKDGYGYGPYIYRSGAYSTGLTNPATLTSPTLGSRDYPYFGLNVVA